MDEKIYYKDESAKITDLRITCNHVTIPIEKIESVVVDFKAATLGMAFALFVAALIAVYIGCIYCLGFCWIGIFFAILALAWLRFVYRNYIELKVSTGTTTIKLLESNMRNRKYIFEIEEALKFALKENRNIQNRV
jgi:hypothetical protein